MAGKNCHGLKRGRAQFRQRRLPVRWSAGENLPGPAHGMAVAVRRGMRQDLKARTKRFALAVIGISATLERHPTARLLMGQLLRSGTGVGANYRAACRAKSRADFVSKLGTAEEECDEAAYWLELLVEAGAMPASSAEPLLDEAGQLTAIFVASIKTARGGGRPSGR